MKTAAGSPLPQLRQERRDYRKLRLDEDNPRLPEALDDKSQAGLMRFFYGNYALDELASSYLANGFFESEALIVLDDGTVLEGNRRLAALKFLLHDDTAQEAGVPEYDTDEEIDQDFLQELGIVPVLVAGCREDLAAYLGYRHISGPKEWSPAAKARYVALRVEAHANDGSTDDVFRVVGREIGSNSLGVRNYYQQYALLQLARDSLGLYSQATEVLSNRFGVWRRLTNENVYGYIGYKPASNAFADVKAALGNVDAERFGLLLDDLVPKDGGRPLLDDSRRASDYTSILVVPEAIEALRITRNFDLALTIVHGSPANQQLQTIYNYLALMNQMTVDGIAVDEETVELSKKVVRLAAAVRDAVKNLLEEQTGGGTVDDDE